MDYQRLIELYILWNKGYGIQKQSVINHLDKYLKQEGDKNNLLTIIIVSMIDWDEAMQLNWANNFIKPLEMQLMEWEIIQNLASKIITIVYELEENDELVNAWARVFKLWVPQWNLDFLIEEMAPLLFPYNSLKESLSLRILSADMILEICSIFGGDAFEKSKKLFNFGWSACNDVNWKIRKLGANRMRRIIKKSTTMFRENKEIYETVVEKMEELMTDEENFVRIDAFETIIQCISCFNDEDVKSKFVPKIKEIFSKGTVEHVEFLHPLSSLWGHLLWTLSQHGMEDLLKEDILIFYQNLLVHEDESLRKKATFNLPYFFCEFYGEDEAKTNNSDEEEVKLDNFSKETWDEYIEKLASDEWDEIQQILASCFHLILKKVSEVNKDLGVYKNILFEFMESNDEIVMSAMVNNIQFIIEIFQNETDLSNRDEVDSTFSEEVKDMNADESKGNLKLSKGKNKYSNF